MPPLKEASESRESASAGRVARTESGRLPRLWLRSVRESTSTVIFGKLFQKVSSTRCTRSSPLMYFDACSSTRGVSRAGVSIHTIREHTSTNRAASTAAVMPSHLSALRHSGLRDAGAAVSGAGAVWRLSVIIG